MLDIPSRLDGPTGGEQDVLAETYRHPGEDSRETGECEKPCDYETRQALEGNRTC